MRTFLNCMAVLVIGVGGGLFGWMLVAAASDGEQDARIAGAERRNTAIAVEVSALSVEVKDTNDKIGVMNRELGELTIQSENFQRTQDATHEDQKVIMILLNDIKREVEGR